jgi:Cu/Ag efflux pump CusA
LYEANTFLIERVDETISGYTAPVVVNIYGNDLDTLDRKALAILRILENTPGATDVQLRAPPGTPVLGVRLQREKLARHGIRPLTVMKAVQTAYEGTEVGQIYQGNRVVPVTVLLDPAVRGKPSSLGNLPIAGSDGALISLDEIADIQHQSGRYVVLRAGAQRLQTVTSNVAGRDLQSFFEDIETRIRAEVEMPHGSYLEFTGAGAERAKSQEQLIVHSLLAGVGILLILFLALRRVTNTLLVLVNLPFSLVGGVVAALLTGATLSLGSLVGFVTLFGITLRNAIMLVSHYQHLVAEEGRPWTLQTAIEGAQHRLPSILITALGTALAMLPIAIDSDNPGREIMGPMAVIIIGGLASSTLLNLLVLPAIMLKYGRFEAPKSESDARRG